ncbi:MAG: dTDP-4-dehydrorhamnose reductase [Chloroflexi bacterium]|nr:dTDP-4-dehydrorhamnose reductase [Chloroflexota bacterium]
MRVFITGAKGQLGSPIAARLGEEVAGRCDLPECDVARADQIGPAIAIARPDLVIHCAALTDVDGCARDPALAYRVNGLGTQNVALACAGAGAALLYISTNEVFDGEKCEPYWEFDEPRPINPYGRSKLAGEWFVSHLLTRFYIVRSSWLYAPGGRNFIHKITQLADEQGRLRVVADEVSSPTLVSDLVEAIVKLIRTDRFGVYHLTNAGCCSRYDWARKVLDLTGRGAVPVEPITRADFPRPSTPPANTALANTCAAALGITLRPWEEALEELLRHLVTPAP